MIIQPYDSTQKNSLIICVQKKTNPINVLLVQSLEKKKQKKILFIFLFTMITKQYSSISFISFAH